ncbi:exopolyphosphatase / guanosine-5'-triphosphate,3'-diphosphate pyrophosphatase [Amycolatopsis arida]|uniref:Exopolyphosphatase / guanosine-5'-triphosphate,3'-diphosphate pyrophosphatase n=1 Tax=Amycolatopsis arida TaxID=587909 RepID=A0A1I5YA87_9PSEU|nr:Ppx/GppA phosphatase family protein [Amycolatopsis arida]TDX90384.1 exopolyphosphatase/guanosine-5'-triphosphate,3'-diphosphate pyrophosphatase [Amycolatopsis arida]SFQ41131.1 exopolyphosphatase / guanosine-5'-triphosphate,3'-diphosphate pyrophosphatase [Amycolatopsis arida]
MRLGVLDVGSNTVHLLVVDAHRGAHPTPMHSEKSVLRLAERITPDGELSEAGADDLVRAVESAKAAAVRLGCADVMAFATSAVREARNSAKVLRRVAERTGVELEVLTGVDEARLTFLAVRRWYGWSAGRLLVLDIGGGSLEVAMGMDEAPELAESLPLGAGRLTRTRFRHDPPTRSELVATSAWLEDQLAGLAEKVGELDPPDHAVATSKTFRSLARLTGAAPSGAGPRVRRTLTDTALRQLIAFISRMSSADLAELEGVSASRSHQLVAGALVAQATMRALSLAELEICPWALREGVILRRLDHSNSEGKTARGTDRGPGE